MADNLIVRFFGDTGPLRRSLEVAGAEAETAGGKFGKVGSVMGKSLKYGAVAGGIAVTAVAGALYESVKAAEAAQVEQAKLRRSVLNAGVSWKRWGSQIIDTQDKLAAQSGFLQTDMYSSMSQLITTTGNATSATKLQGVAMNLARARGLTLAQTSTILSKVWNGNTTSLVRLGISLSKVTTNQDALKAKTGTATAAQVAAAKAADLVATRQAALAALQQKFGGQWQAYAGTAQGATARFGVALHQLEETIGKALLPVVARAFTALAGWTTELTHSQTAANIAHGAASLLGKAMSFLGNVVGQVAGFIRQHWAQIRSAIQTAANFVSTQVLPRLSAAIRFVMQVGASLAKGFAQAWPQIKSAIATAWNAIKPLLSALGNLIANVIMPAILWLSKHSGPAFQVLAGAIKVMAKIATPILGALAAVINGIVSALQHTVSLIKWVASNMPDNPFGSGGPTAGQRRRGVTGLPGGNSVVASAALGGVQIHVHVAGSVVTHQDLVRGVRDGLVQLGRAQRGAGGVFGGLT